MPLGDENSRSESRRRRAHAKSRGGCLRCKSLRKKCDEVRPSCSRCSKQNSSCKYASIFYEQDTAVTDSLHNKTSIHKHVTAQGPSHLDRPERNAGNLSTEPTAFWNGISRLDATPPENFNSAAPSSLLSSRELELFSHYISHTSRVIPSDQEDTFALHVGIPNLALTMPAVMGSVLALSAACRCHDILHTSPDPLQKLEEMHELLVLADRHHQKSLGQLREAISNSNFNAVLANGALMVLYALSGHWVRIRLARKATGAGISLHNDILPVQSQWITSIRTAYVAYVSLEQHISAPGSKAPSPNSTLTEAQEASPLALRLQETEGCRYTPEDGPSEETKRLLLPIVSTTYKAAVDKLRLRCQKVADLTSDDDTGISACMKAFSLLENIIGIVLGNDTPNQEWQGSQGSGVLHHAYPWLARYLSRVTSAAPSRLSRRTTTSFLNRVPFEFLQLVQSALDSMPTETTETDSRYHEDHITLAAAHQPAMDIFAHWLVLVMLLDGVWWIGGIGSWELGRVVRFAESRGWLPELSASGTWWPETMRALNATLSGAD